MNDDIKDIKTENLYLKAIILVASGKTCKQAAKKVGISRATFFRLDQKFKEKRCSHKNVKYSTKSGYVHCSGCMTIFDEWVPHE